MALAAQAKVHVRSLINWHLTRQTGQVSGSCTSGASGSRGPLSLLGRVCSCALVWPASVLTSVPVAKFCSAEVVRTTPADAGKTSSKTSNTIGCREVGNESERVIRSTEGEGERGLVSTTSESDCRPSARFRRSDSCWTMVVAIAAVTCKGLAKIRSACKCFVETKRSKTM